MALPDVLRKKIDESVTNEEQVFLITLPEINSFMRLNDNDSDQYHFVEK